MLVPERLTSRAEARAALGAQFWEQPVSSARTLTGAVTTTPGEPPPLAAQAPQGAVRCQQLLVLQAGVGPVAPGYDGSNGGVVSWCVGGGGGGGWLCLFPLLFPLTLHSPFPSSPQFVDRALAATGGKNWWAALTGRARVARLWQAHAGGAKLTDVLKDASAYSLAAHTRATAGPVKLNAVLEVPDARSLSGKRSGASALPRGLAPRGRATATASLPGGHAARALVTAGTDCVDGAAAYERVPLVVAADVASGPRGDGMQYRVGVRHARRSASTTASSSAAASPPCPATHVQGAVAVEGEAVLWRRAPGARWRGASAVAPLPPADADAGASDTDDALAVAPPARVAGGRNDRPPAPPPTVRRRPPRPGGRLAAADARAATAAAAGPPPREPQPADPLADIVGADWVVSLDADGDASVVEVVPNSEGGKNADAATTTTSPPPQSPAADLLASLDAATKALSTLRSASGRLRRASRAAAARRAAGAPLPARVARAPYTPGVGTPSARLFGAVGVLARIPITPATLRPRSARARTASPPPPSPRPRRAPPRDGGAFPAAAPLAALRTAAARVGAAAAALADGDAWAPSLAGTALRVFGCAGATLQLGRFARPLLDYTHVSARLDLGLAAESAGGGSGVDDGLSFAHPLRDGPPAVMTARAAATAAAMAAAAGSWHALSLSACQQVAGPLRARCDVRWALEATPPAPAPASSPTHSAPPIPLRRPGSARSRSGAAAGAAAAAAWTAARGVRAARLETVYGLDYVLPGTEGTLRLCGWWSPARREAMCELRLL